MPLVTIMKAVVAQLAERVLGKNEVSGSIPDNGSMGEKRRKRAAGKSEAERGVILEEALAAHEAGKHKKAVTAQ